MEAVAAAATTSSDDHVAVSMRTNEPSQNEPSLAEDSNTTNNDDNSNRKDQDSNLELDKQEGILPVSPHSQPGMSTPNSSVNSFQAKAASFPVEVDDRQRDDSNQPEDVKNENEAPSSIRSHQTNESSSAASTPDTNSSSSSRKVSSMPIAKEECFRKQENLDDNSEALHGNNSPRNNQNEPTSHVPLPVAAMNANPPMPSSPSVDTLALTVFDGTREEDTILTPTTAPPTTNTTTPPPLSPPTLTTTLVLDSDGMTSQSSVHRNNSYNKNYKNKKPLTAQGFLRALELEDEILLSDYVLLPQDDPRRHSTDYSGEDCFLSHRGPDTKRDLVVPLARTLTNLYGYRLFVDAQAVNEHARGSGHLPKRDVLRHALWKCQSMLILISRTFDQSSWCLRELYTALYRRRGDSDFELCILWCDGLTPELGNHLPAYAGLQLHRYHPAPPHQGGEEESNGATAVASYQPYTTLEGFAVDCLHPVVRHLISGPTAPLVSQAIFTETWRWYCPLKPPTTHPGPPPPSVLATRLQSNGTPLSTTTTDVVLSNDPNTPPFTRTNKDAEVASNDNDVTSHKNNTNQEQQQPRAEDVEVGSSSTSRSSPSHDDNQDKSKKPPSLLSSWNRNPTLRYTFWILILLILLCGVGIIVAVVLRNTKDDDDNNNNTNGQSASLDSPSSSTTSNPSVPPTLSPSTLSPTTAFPTRVPTPTPSGAPSTSTAPSMDPRKVVLVEFLRNQTRVETPLQYPAQDLSTSSIEELALTWLVDEDSLALEVNDASSQRRIVQRYALATLWFLQTPETTWRQVNQINWLSAAHECEWAMVTCRNTTITNDNGEEVGMDLVVDQLALGRLKLTGTISEDVGLLTDVTSLELTGNSLIGPFPPLVLQMTSLTVLRLDGNALTGPIPNELGTTLTQLQDLRLWNNLLTGTLPSSIGELSRLTYLDTGNNPSLGGVLPTTLTQLTALESMRLWINNFTGPIPENIGDLEALESLLLSNNDLTGTLPSSFGLLSNLVVFYAGFNPQLGGPLPNVTLLTSLTHLWLEDTDFTGPIPEDVGGMSSLQYLILTNNRLSGTIPTSIGQLSNLLQFRVLLNPELRGPIPSSMADLTKLSLFNIHNTSLTGEVPLCSVVDSRSYSIVAADCDQVNCTCCTQCCDRVTGSEDSLFRSVCALQ